MKLLGKKRIIALGVIAIALFAGMVYAALFQAFQHTHLVRGGSVMLQPTRVRSASMSRLFAHTHLVRGGSLML